MGFLDELNANSKTRTEFEAEQLKQKSIEEKRYKLEQENIERAKIIEFEKNLELFIKIIKNVCLKAASQGIYVEKSNRKIINGKLAIREARDRDGDYIGVEYYCNAYILKKRHLFKDDEYNNVNESVTFILTKGECDAGMLRLSKGIWDSEKEKYQEILIDFIKGQISEISFGKRELGLSQFYIPFSVAF